MTDFSHSDVISQFRDAMRAAGISTSDHLIADGKLHRVHVDGDHRSKRNGWFTLYIDDHPAGVFGCNKRLGQESIKWSMKGIKRLSREELRALTAKAKADGERRAVAQRAKFDAAAARANIIWGAAEPCETHVYLARKGIKSHGFRIGAWVLDRGHDPETGEVHEIRIPGALLIKVRNAENKIVSLQAIFPEKNEDLGRDRDFLAGGEKKGCWFSIGAPADIAGKKTVVICEGVATAASVHEATGIGCVVAFDAGNLKPVAETIRRLWPDMVIIIAGDNDQWTIVPVANPGLHFGKAAAEAVGGYIVGPCFADLAGYPTDFNDLHARQGLPAVAMQIMAALAVEPEKSGNLPEIESETPPERTGPREKTKDEIKAERAAKREAKIAAAHAHQAYIAANPDMYDPSKYFTVLGHDRIKIFVYSHEMKLVVSHPITGWNKHTMTQIARTQFWKIFSPDPDDPAPPNWDFCENWLINEAYKRGFFDPSMSRGRGAWMDEDRVVYHFGNMLAVDGVETAVTAIKSKFVYEQGHLLPPPADEPLSDADGRRLLDIAKMFRWEKPSSAVLLAGWVALAPICGALKWRSHIWITGAAGSGKTTILNDFVSVLTAGTAMFAQGSSTEAGIRQQLRCDALPVLFDESEQGDEKAEFRVQNIIGLARQASSESGAKTYKGTANGEGAQYLIRSSFCLCSIQVNIKNDADRDRLTLLALKPPREGDTGGTWEQIKESLYSISRDEDLPARLMRRALDLLPTTLKNIDVFATAAAEKFGSQREGDQYGTLMAGAWSMVSSKLATPEQAAAMIARYDWSEYVEHTETDDATKALSALLGALIRVPRGEQVTVFELVRCATGQTVESCNIQMKDADSILRRHGMAVQFGETGIHSATLLVANNSTEIPKLLEGTPYAMDFRGQLLRYKGASKYDKPVKFNGLKSRCVAIAISDIVASELAEPTTSYEPGAFDDDVPF